MEGFVVTLNEYGTNKQPSPPLTGLFVKTHTLSECRVALTEGQTPLKYTKLYGDIIKV